MNRRDFLQSAGVVSAGLVFPNARRLLTGMPPLDRWRIFNVTTRVEVLQPAGLTRIWLPLPLLGSMPFQRTLSNEYSAPGGIAHVSDTKADALGIVAAQFPAGVKPVAVLNSRIATRDWKVDLLASGRVGQERRTTLDHFLRPTKLLPTDGIVKKTADEITRTSTTDIGKARAIYDWIVDNTFRDPKTRGCGMGDIRFMLESRDLGGKCADLNALYVGLARAAGLPARDAYGIRIAKSELGYKSLGTSSENVTKAQHCRAEVYLTGHGWAPVDPADVRKVVLEEPPGNLPLDHDTVTKARARLFGSWEMNWVAYNFGHDVALPGTNGRQVPFLMYPQAETGKGPVDCLDPDSFRYEITAKEIAPRTNNRGGEI